VLLAALIGLKKLLAVASPPSQRFSASSWDARKHCTVRFS
jgi:hypothetical protein